MLLNPAALSPARAHSPGSHLLAVTDDKMLSLTIKWEETGYLLRSLSRYSQQVVIKSRSANAKGCRTAGTLQGLGDPAGAGLRAPGLPGRSSGWGQAAKARSEGRSYETRKLCSTVSSHFRGGKREPQGWLDIADFSPARPTMEMETDSLLWREVAAGDSCFWAFNTFSLSTTPPSLSVQG